MPLLTVDVIAASLQVVLLGILNVYFYLDVETDGKITNWGLEMGPPNGLERSGWSRNTMQVGDQVTVEGTLAKDGSKQANARSVTMSDTGKKLGAASSESKQ